MVSNSYKPYTPPCIEVEEVVLEFAILGGGSFSTQSLNSEDVDEDE